ncbi:MAG: trypsin-like peptidase domain-containing protein, partial [Actinobacteria bacterium]|nr:trypsin-like peptidase domain-containing protein [Actinomycetota bacterium]
MNPTRSRTPLFLAGLIAALGLGVGVGAAAYAVLSDESTTVVRQVTVSDSEPAATADGFSIGEIYERSQKAVVEITASATQFSGSQSAQGSGFVFDEGGHIVTNQHVVEGASSISVRFWDGSSRRARLVGTDPSTDLAVIDVNAPASFLEPLRLGDSSDVDVGDGVVALGSPFGLEGT